MTAIPFFVRKQNKNFQTSHIWANVSVLKINSCCPTSRPTFFFYVNGVRMWPSLKARGITEAKIAVNKLQEKQMILMTSQRNFSSVNDIYFEEQVAEGHILNTELKDDIFLKRQQTYSYIFTIYFQKLLNKCIHISFLRFIYSLLDGEYF